MKKRIVSFFLVLALCAALLPTIALADAPALSGAGTPRKPWILTQESFRETNTSEDSNPKWNPFYDDGHYSLSSGSYKLENDIELNHHLEIGLVNLSADVVLDLNGHKLTTTAPTMLIINVNSTLTLMDSSTGKSGEVRSSGKAIYFSPYATLNANGGSVYGEISVNGVDAKIQRDTNIAGITSFYGYVSGDTPGAISSGIFFGGIQYDRLSLISGTKHTVTFSAGETEPFAKAVVVGGDTKITPPEKAPTKEGYIFGGWYKDEEGTEAWDFDENIVADDITLYAKWMPEADGEGFVIAGGLLSGILESAANALEETFVDVSRGAYYYNAVQWAAERGIAGGVDKKHFAPDESCTRAQAITMLWRAAGCPAVWAENPFVDVDANDYFYEAVLWAVANGITSGADETHFSPDAPCTRGQIVTFLHRAERCYDAHESFGFTDVKTGSYCEDAINWAVENAITNGTDVSTFSPDDTCTRSQIVTFLYRNR